eukprot:scaffold128871_cov32-Tisochrysis_lutea.AAC.4
MPKIEWFSHGVHAPKKPAGLTPDGKYRVLMAKVLSSPVANHSEMIAFTARASSFIRSAARVRALARIRSRSKGSSSPGRTTQLDTGARHGTSSGTPRRRRRATMV